MTTGLGCQKLRADRIDDYWRITKIEQDPDAYKLWKDPRYKMPNKMCPDGKYKRRVATAPPVKPDAPEPIKKEGAFNLVATASLVLTVSALF